MSEIALPALFKRSLEAGSRASNLVTIEDETQHLVRSSLDGLRQVHTRVRDLALFSPNESLDDISTKDMAYLTLPYVFGDVENRLRTTERADRMEILAKAIDHLQTFVYQVEHYGIIPEQEKNMYSLEISTLADPTRRREGKVAQYKKLKEIKSRIQVLQKQRGLPASSFVDTATDMDLITSLLPSPSSSTLTAQVQDLDPNTDDILRETSILLLQMFYAQAHGQLESMRQELELLRHAPSHPSDTSPLGDGREGRRKENSDENIWRLDAPFERRELDGKGPLLDQQGRPLRPFTILPSDMAKRVRLQAQVFGTGYNLPTMTVEEYLDIERERGNIITGGGAASLNKPTTSEQLAVDSEMDGTIKGEEKAEEKRQKDERWAQYKDTHPRGIGNTMNRG